MKWKKVDSSVMRGLNTGKWKRFGTTCMALPQCDLGIRKVWTVARIEAVTSFGFVRRLLTTMFSTVRVARKGLEAWTSWLRRRCVCADSLLWQFCDMFPNSGRLNDWLASFFVSCQSSIDFSIWSLAWVATEWKIILSFTMLRPFSSTNLSDLNLRRVT